MYMLEKYSKKIQSYSLVHFHLFMFMFVGSWNNIFEFESNFLQTLPECANKQTCVYGFESHQTNIKRKIEGILWMYTKTYKLLKS